MRTKFEITLMLFGLGLLPGLSFAQINTWQLVVAETTRIAAPELPVGFVSFLTKASATTV